MMNGEGFPLLQHADLLLLFQAAIRKELNEFKSTEMEVHELSRHLTRLVLVGAALNVPTATGPCLFSLFCCNFLFIGDPAGLVLTI